MAVSTGPGHLGATPGHPRPPHGHLVVEIPGHLLVCVTVDLLGLSDVLVSVGWLVPVVLRRRAGDVVVGSVPRVVCAVCRGVLVLRSGRLLLLAICRP